LPTTTEVGGVPLIVGGLFVAAVAALAASHRLAAEKMKPAGFRKRFPMKLSIDPPLEVKNR
jgi:hypothetical protein